MIKMSKLILGIVGGLLSLYTISCYDLTKSEKKPASLVSIHKPYEDKKCEQCHNKVKSYEWKSDFCLTCHDKKSYELSKEYKHEPAVENCTSCHDPHKSEFKYLLKKEAKTLCLECHETKIRDNKIHSKLEKTCIECHAPHASEYKLLLKRGGHEVCLLCHTQEEYNQKKLNKKNLTLKECKSCHEKNDLSGDCCEKEK